MTFWFLYSIFDKEYFSFEGVHSLFKIGDKVVYPMHGAGIIESIEEREILGEIQKYYVMKIPIGDMKVLIPMNNVENIGLRGVINNEEADQVLQRMRDYVSEDNINWNRRYRVNLDKIKTGDINEVADVVRSLMIRDDEKGLSSGERKMLDNARQILISEIALARNLKENEILEMLGEMFAIS